MAEDNSTATIWHVPVINPEVTQDESGNWLIRILIPDEIAHDIDEHAGIKPTLVLGQIILEENASYLQVFIYRKIK